MGVTFLKIQIVTQFVHKISTSDIVNYNNVENKCYRETTHNTGDDTWVSLFEPVRKIEKLNQIWITRNRHCRRRVVANTTKSTQTILYCIFFSYFSGTNHYAELQRYYRSV